MTKKDRFYYIMLECAKSERNLQTYLSNPNFEKFVIRCMTKIETQMRVKNEKKESSVFIKPTIAEIKEFMSESKIFNVDAEKFWNFYESNGWRVGKNPMRNWKSAVHTWKQNSAYNPNNTETKKVKFLG